MDEYTIAGYGIDLAQIYNSLESNHKLHDNEKNLYHELIDSNDFFNVVDELTNDLEVANLSLDTPSNTDAFEKFINLPDLPQVVNNLENNPKANVTTRKVYTKAGADQLIETYIDKLFYSLYEDIKPEESYQILDNLTNKFQDKVTTFASHENFQDVC